MTDAIDLVDALRAHGLPADVEAQGKMLIVRVPTARLAELSDPARRASVVAMARRFGYSHVAVEATEHRANT